MNTDLFIINMILFLVSLLLGLLIAGPVVNFLPERTIVVDKIKSNFLVRGNIPIVNGAFVLPELKAQL